MDWHGAPPYVLLAIAIGGALVALYNRVKRPGSDWYRPSWYLLGVSLPIAGAMGHMMMTDGVRSALGWQRDGAGGFQTELAMVLLGFGVVGLAVAIQGDDENDTRAKTLGAVLGVSLALLAARHAFALYFTAPDRPGMIAIACATDALAAAVLLFGSYDIILA
jgi:hypothetical protein